ncbi:MAG: hypothetical protein M1495_00870 [Bacteroidetes bacterium]|nr:hypothetical protein [Bacteroidota bacterium]
MKIKFVFFSTIMAIALTLPMLGQNNQDDKTKSEMKMHDMSSMMGKPTVDTTVEGLHMKVWLMTQKHHKKMMKKMRHERMEMKDTNMAMNKDMKGMNHDGMMMDKATKEAMMAGTHHIMLFLTDAASGNEISNASVKILIVSPSKKNSSVDLKPMMNHFGVGLELDDEGEYQFTVSVNVDGVIKTTQFQYEVED